MGTATLTKPTSSSVTRSTATVKYAASGFSLPSTQTGDWVEGTPSDTSQSRTRQVITYTDLKYSWSFGGTSASGSYNFSVTAGSAKNISATVTVTCTKTTTTQTSTRTRTYTPASGTPGQEGYTPASYGTWSSWSTPTSGSSSSTTHTVGTATSNTITVYGKPSAFSWGANVKEEETIQSSTGLSVTKWNELVTKTGQWVSWRNQGDYYGDYDSAKASSGDIIRAWQHETIRGALGAGGGTTNSGDLITAEHFLRLETAINA